MSAWNAAFLMASSSRSKLCARLLEGIIRQLFTVYILSAHEDVNVDVEVE